MVAGLCRALLRNATEAEDAAQQVFLSAHRSLLNGAEPREPAAWLATIARNECWARIKERMREPLASDTADQVAGPADPVAEAIRRADLAALWRAIRALPKQQREALLLREFGGLRYDELAAALAVTEPAVESLLFRARMRLRAQLQAAAAALAPLARLVATGGVPAVATKAVALGLGAAAVTGTAVVAPTMLEHHASHHGPAARRTVDSVRESAQVALVQTPAVIRHAVNRGRTETETRGRNGEGRGDRARRRDGGDEREHATTTAAAPTTTQTETRSSGDGDRDHTTTTTTTTATEPTTTTTSSGDGGHDSGGGGETATVAVTTVELSGDGGSGGSDSGSDGGGGHG